MSNDHGAPLGNLFSIYLSVAVIFSASGCSNSAIPGLTGSGKKESNRRVNDADEDNADLQGSKGGNKNQNKNPKDAPPQGDSSTPPSSGPRPSTPPTNEETKRDAERAVQLTDDFKSWCTMALQTKPLTNDRLKALHSDLCDNNGPKELFTGTLISQAYVGTGDPTLYPLKEISSDSATRTTNYRFAIAIKIPLSIKDHFDKVGPKGGDVNEIKSLQEATGGQATVSLLQSFTNDGPFHVRGWLTNSKVTKPVFITTITVSSDTRNDQFKMKEGDIYMYTQYTDKAIQNIKFFDIITAGIRIDTNSYLISVVNASIDNLGFSSTAETEIRKLALAGIKRMYTLAKETATAP